MSYDGDEQEIEIMKLDLEQAQAERDLARADLSRLMRMVLKENPDLFNRWMADDRNEAD